MHESAVHAWCQLGEALRNCQASLEAAVAGSQQAAAAALENAQIRITKSKRKQLRGEVSGPLDIATSESKPARIHRVYPLASLSFEQSEVEALGPANEAVRWIQGQLWSVQHAGGDALGRITGARRERGKETPAPEFLVRKNQTARLSRTLEFWQRSVLVYGSYKVCQARAALIRDPEEKQALWDRQHEAAAERLYRLCVDLGGFFLKSGQFLAKPDLVPPAWVKRLSVLQDAAPETPFEDVKRTLEREIGRPVEEVFEELWERPIGSASVAQVHRGRLRSGGREVAVKVQHPGSEALMMQDLRNHRNFAAFLQKFELPFDLLSVLAELEHQVQYEFDFQHEAQSMDVIGRSLAEGPKSGAKKWESPVLVPRSVPGLVTRQVLVMDFLDGVQITRLKDEMKKRRINPDGLVARRTKRRILEDLTSAYGHMILRDGFFQADPHPGNIIVCKGGKVGLLDYGQTKRLPEPLRLQYAHLVLALNQRDEVAITDAFKALGIQTEKPPDVHSASKMAGLMFDTRMPKDRESLNPFTDESEIQKNPVTTFPKDLFFVLRTVQLLRGLTMGMGIDWSVAEAWKPLAEEVLGELGEPLVTVAQKPQRGLRGLVGRPFAWRRKAKEKRRHLDPPPIEWGLEEA